MNNRQALLVLVILLLGHVFVSGHLFAAEQIPSMGGGTEGSVQGVIPSMRGIGPREYIPASPADELREVPQPMAPGKDEPLHEFLERKAPPAIKDENTARL